MAGLSPTPAAVAWTEIRKAAVSAAARGWPVVPGTFLAGDGQWYGRGAGPTELRPIRDSWQTEVITDEHAALETWTHRPYGVLLVCGLGVDVLEVPAELAELLPALQRLGLALPVATVVPPPRWLLFVATGSGKLLTPLVLHGAVLRTEGDWVALPPTDLGHGRARWRVEPPERRPLPDADEVQQVLADAFMAGPPGDHDVH